MISSVIIQSGLLDRIKSISAITSLVTNSNGIVEIREDTWQGTDFEYPNIRLEWPLVSPSIEGCNYSAYSHVWKVFSEEDSSKEALDIISVIANNFPVTFNYTTGGQNYNFHGIRISASGMDRPIRVNLRTWQTNLRYQGRISLA
jgi:hypothetical protein